MDTLDKLRILTDAAKYDVACTSSGSDRSGRGRGLGNAVACGICHSFTADGRCVSLLKVLMTNYCVYDCQYCVNRRSHDTRRTAFTPRELAHLTIAFYRRNYIEGLFLSSGVLRSPDYTCERMIETLSLLRREYHFNGYIHAKAIPGADPALITQLGLLADRLSCNIELPSQQSLSRLAPDKTKTSILKPMSQIRDQMRQSQYEVAHYHGAAAFAPAGQSTQMIVGASPETDFQILKLTEGLYQKYRLKRVFFSAYTPVMESPLLPALTTKPPLLREHRLYQADWLLRFYRFKADELLSEENPSFHPLLDPKCNWALHHPEVFPVEINRAPYELLLRVPGLGPRSAKRIVKARRLAPLDYDALKKIGVVLKRARYFILCNGRAADGLNLTHDAVLRSLLTSQGLAYRHALESAEPEQLSLFDPSSQTLRSLLKEGIAL